MKASEALQEARKLIDAGWCQGAYVRYRNGRCVPFLYDITYQFNYARAANERYEAADYCPLGAIGAVCYARTPNALYDFSVDQVARVVAAKVESLLENHIAPELSLSAWNDKTGRTKEQVLELFDMGIADALKEEKGNGK
jgi:hypothetical protein